MSRLAAMVVDGPCTGFYDIQRAPARMVFTRATDGRTYALDEDGDRVEYGENAFVYQTDGNVGFVCGHGPGLPARTLTYSIAATMDAATGEIEPLTPEQLAPEREAAHEQLLAWALGETTREAPAQEALF